MFELLDLIVVEYYYYTQYTIIIILLLLLLLLEIIGGKSKLLKLILKKVYAVSSLQRSTSFCWKKYIIIYFVYIYILSIYIYTYQFRKNVCHEGNSDLFVHYINAVFGRRSWFKGRRRDEKKSKQCIVRCR